MGINLYAIAFIVLLLGANYVYSCFSIVNEKTPELPWVPIQVGKTKTYTSMTRDAGMYIEKLRRTAIIGNPTGKVSYKGSTNGSLEWNFLTGICICPPRGNVCPDVPENVVWDGGDTDEVCDNIDAGGAFGGYDVVDFGGANIGNVCEV